MSYEQSAASDGGRRSGRWWLGRGVRGRAGRRVREGDVEAMRTGLRPVVARELVHAGTRAAARAQAEEREVGIAQGGHAAVLVGLAVRVDVAVGAADLLRDARHARGIASGGRRVGGPDRAGHDPGDEGGEGEHGREPRPAGPRGRTHDGTPLPVDGRAIIDWDCADATGARKRFRCDRMSLRPPRGRGRRRRQRSRQRDGSARTGPGDAARRPVTDAALERLTIAGRPGVRDDRPAPR